jgi:DNA-binding beta-propeller fold protein YncE
MGIATSDAGEVFVLEAASGLILKFGADEKLIDTFGDMSVLSHPIDIAVNDRDKLIYVSDVAEHNIAVFDLQGKLLYKIGERGTNAGQFNFPTGIDLDEAGNLYVLDTLNFRIQVLDSAGHFVREFGEQGTEIGSFRLPKGLAVSPHGQVYVSDVLSHKVVVFNLQGRYLMSLGGRSHARDDKVTPGGFFAPRGIAVDATGSILVVDGINKMIQRFQYLTEDYLLAHPILEEEIYLPPVYRSLPRTSVVPVVKSAGDF